MENLNPSLLPSPHSHSSSSNNNKCSRSSTVSDSNGRQASAQFQTPSPTPSPTQPPQQLLLPITGSEPNTPYTTTFVQAYTSSFKQVVQMLTGNSETAKQASFSRPVNNPTLDPVSRTHIPPIKSTPTNKQSGYNLYERRNSRNKNIRINALIPVFGSSDSPGFSPRKPEILSPSILDFPALVLNPVTPLISDPFDRSLSEAEEEKAVKDKGFFLHPSPTNTPRAEPRLLPLFPTTSPRMSGSSSTSH